MHCFGVLKCYCVCSYSAYFVRLVQYTELSVIDTMHLMEIARRKRRKAEQRTNSINLFYLKISAFVFFAPNENEIKNENSAYTNSMIVV